MNKYVNTPFGHEQFDYDWFYPFSVFNCCERCMLRNNQLEGDDYYTCEVYLDGIPPKIWKIRNKSCFKEKQTKQPPNESKAVLLYPKQEKGARKMLTWLKELLGEAYSEEIEKKAEEHIGKEYVPKSNLDALREVKAQLEQEVETRDKQIEKLKKTDPEKLQEQITQLQEQNAQDKANYETRLKETQINNAVERSLITSKYMGQLVSACVVFPDLGDFALAIIYSIANALDTVFGTHMADTVKGWQDDLQSWANKTVGEKKVTFERFDASQYDKTRLGVENSFISGYYQGSQFDDRVNEAVMVVADGVHN